MVDTEAGMPKRSSRRWKLSGRFEFTDAVLCRRELFVQVRQESEDHYWLHALLESVIRPRVASSVRRSASAAFPPREPVTVGLLTAVAL